MQKTQVNISKVTPSTPSTLPICKLMVLHLLPDLCNIILSYSTFDEFLYLIQEDFVRFGWRSQPQEDFIRPYKTDFEAILTLISKNIFINDIKVAELIIEFGSLTQLEWYTKRGGVLDGWHKLLAERFQGKNSPMFTYIKKYLETQST